MVFELDKFVQKYEVRPETIAFIKARQAEGGKSYIDLGVDAAREASISSSAKYGGTTDFTGEEREIAIPSPYDKDGIPVTIYHPHSCNSLATPTLLIYFHGGGNVLGCRQTHATVCKIIARDTPCIVLNVEYRLAPEHKFPANTKDAECVVEWVSKNKTAVGGSPESKLGVSGDSAGGRISAVVCHEASDLIDFSVLIYPNVDSTFSLPSVKEFEDGPLLSKAVIDWFMSMHAVEDRTDVRASPLLNKDFCKLPPTLLIVAELDPLRDGCYAYYKKLQDAGVKSRLVTIKGVPHAFWSTCAAYPEACKEAHGEAVKFIKEQSA